MSRRRGGRRPIRFCLLTTFYPPWSFGGDGIQVERLARALADRGHEVTVVCAPKVYRLLGGGGIPAPPPHPRVEVIKLEDGALALTGTYLTGRPLRSRRRLRRLLDRGFDVIHFHNPSLLGAPALFELGPGLKLYTAHEQWLLCPSHVLLRRDGSVCEDPPCWSCELAHRRPPQLWRRTGLLERSLRCLDALIVPSRTSAELHRRFRSLVRTEVIEFFVPEPGLEGGAPASPERPYFLHCGRLEPIKGVDRLIEAFARGRSEGLVIAGWGSRSRRLRRQARGLENVRFAGQLGGAELEPLYRDALALVMSTVGHEGLPLAALEGFAAGTPVVLPSFGSMGELIADTGAGLGYSSPGELDTALDRLAADEGLRLELGRRGRAAFERRFSESAHLRRYLGLVAGLAGGRGETELAGAAALAAEDAGTQ